MARLKWAVDGLFLSRTILLCAVFIGLNILDAWLTGIALGAGSYELNPFMSMGIGSNMLTKGLISMAIGAALILFKRGGLLKPLSLGMLIICAWNGFAVLSWI